MTAKKNLTLNGLVLPNFIFVVLSGAMVATGLYLTNHYFATHFPSGIQSSTSLCDINSFWGCDKATTSSFGSLLGAPTSIFGIIIGILGLITAFTGSAAMERTMKTVLLVNLVGCVLLFIYSLVALSGLCPMCTVYYVVSGGAFFMMFKYSDEPWGFDPKILGMFFLITAIPVIALNFVITSKEKKTNQMAQAYIKSFNNENSYGAPAYESPYKLHMATEKFGDAPIQVTIFSDFQCPYCKKAADVFHDLAQDFKDKINIQYMFYPLDPACNSGMKGGGHPYACQAAYLSACHADKFLAIHDHIFANQEQINSQNLKAWAKKFNVDESCFSNPKIQDAIQQTLNAGAQYKLRSTPTIIINGKKIEGLLPKAHLKSILNSIIKQ